MRRPIVGYVVDGDTLCPECATDAYQCGALEVDAYGMRDAVVGSDANGLPDSLVSADSGDAVGVVLGYLPEDMARSGRTCADCHTFVAGA